jgi:Ycf66 protein N-terminus
MLNHLLAGIVGLGGLSLFLSGFFFPEVRRKSDFAWSGVALLYALVLWIEGDHTSSGALLGHAFSVTLIAWFGWQTLQQRQQLAAPEEKTSIPNSLETLTPFLKAGGGRMMVAYGEAADWLQTQLGKGDTGALESPTSQSPQGDTLEDAWSDETSVASANAPISAGAVAADTLVKPEPELTALSEAEMQVETPQAEELQPEPEGSEDAPPLAVPDSPVGEANSATAAAASELSHEVPVEEMVAESKSAPLDEAQGMSNEDTMHDEDVAHNPTPEDDDGSWPPEDPVT